VVQASEIENLPILEANEAVLDIARFYAGSDGHIQISLVNEFLLIAYYSESSVLISNLVSMQSHLRKIKLIPGYNIVSFYISFVDITIKDGKINFQLEGKDLEFLSAFFLLDVKFLLNINKEIFNNIARHNG
jgi:hypothetical protein